MRLTKYNGSPRADRTMTSLIGSSSSDVDNNNYGGSGGLNRTIWGQNDTGEDIDGHQTVNGDVHIKCIIPPQYDPDDPDEDVDGDDEEMDEGGGNLDVELDITVGRHLYINDPHPAHSGEKKCVGELINGLDGRITTNANNISNLTTRVTTAEGNITNLTSRMDDAEGDIQTNADDIANLKASNLTVDDVLKLIKDNQPSKLGAYDQPVILFTGRARRVSYYSDKYYIEGSQLPYFTLTNSIEQGLMTITITPNTGYSVNVKGVQCNQERSGDTTDSIDNPYIKGRSDGAHWFEYRVDALAGTTKVYIREFHQGNGDNDTWYSDNWYGDGGIKAIHFTLIGYITPPST